MNLKDLSNIELIKQLKGRYFRTLDTNDWKAFGDCLTSNCKASYSDGRLKLEGREAIVAFMSKHMSGEKLLSMHNGHTPEISLKSESAASGIWYLNDMVIDLERRTQLIGAAIYQDEYCLEDGVWRISYTSYARTFEYFQPLSEDVTFVKNMFESNKKS